MSKPIHPINPTHMFSSLWSHRGLIWVMTKREVIGRYRGSLLGILWSFFNPVIMLAIYTFVFSVVFEARWGELSGGKGEFAVILFSGMIVHALFSESISRAPSLILGNNNYVKKVVFPLEILPWISMGTTLFHWAMSLFVLLIFITLFGSLNWTVLMIPLVMIPLVILTMGFSWLLASLGVFIRDMGQVMGLFTTILLFLSPIFYPITAIPEKYRAFLYLNPLTFMIEQTRGVLIFGKSPEWMPLGIYFVASLLVAWLGFFWFQKTRKGFADVL